jgi:hypothetical protein
MTRISVFIRFGDTRCDSLEGRRKSRFVCERIDRPRLSTHSKSPVSFQSVAVSNPFCRFDRSARRRLTIRSWALIGWKVGISLGFQSTEPEWDISPSDGFFDVNLVEWQKNHEDWTISVIPVSVRFVKEDKQFKLTFRIEIYAFFHELHSLSSKQGERRLSAFSRGDLIVLSRF